MTITAAASKYSGGSPVSVRNEAGNNPGATTITLSNNTNFVLGVTWDGGATYWGDTDFAPQSSPDSYLILFDGMDGQRPRSGVTLAIDLAPIPVPPAVWLFGSGLLGLVAVARRRL